MGQLIDNTIALRVLYLLVRDFTEWEAFKLGIIDDHGARTEKEITTQKEKDSWTMLHRLVARLRKILAKVPGGETSLARLTAAYLLVKEQYENNIIYEDIERQYEFLLLQVNEEDISALNTICEDAGTTIGNVATIPPTNKDPIVPGIKNAYTDRNKKRRVGPDIIRRSAVLEFKTWQQTHYS